MRYKALITGAAALATVVLAGGYALAAGTQTDVTFSGCLAGGKLAQVQVTRTPSCAASATPVQWAGQAVLRTASPSPSPTVTSPTPSPSPTVTGACTVSLGQNCGPFSYAQIPMSNGFDTYVGPQNVGSNAGTTASLTAVDPGNWSVQVSAVPAGYTGVQIFANIQQLTNDWCGSGWGGCASPTNTPLDSLSTLQVSYSETSPHDAGSVYEFAPDVWSDNYGTDVMFWVDTSPLRCTDNGLNAGDILGQATLGGQAWTVYRYGGAGGEIVLILDGTASTDPVDTGTCAQQASGTIDIKAGFDWLTGHGFITGPEVITQLNSGWEITSADSTTFAVNSYSITAG